MLTLKQSDYDKIVAHAKANLPEEACGLIAGTKDGDVKEIKKVYLLTNVDHTNEHFSMDPKEQLAAVKDMRAMGWYRLATGIRIRSRLRVLRKKTSDWHMIRVSII